MSATPWNINQGGLPQSEIDLERLVDEINTINWHLEVGAEGWTQEDLQLRIGWALPILVSWSIAPWLGLILSHQQYYDAMLYEVVGPDPRLHLPALQRIRAQVWTWQAQLAAQNQPPTPAPPTTALPRARLPSLPPIETIPTADDEDSPPISPSTSAEDSDVSLRTNPPSDVTELHLGDALSGAEVAAYLQAGFTVIEILPAPPHNPWRPRTILPMPGDGSPVRAQGEVMEAEMRRSLEVTIRRRFGLGG